MCIRDRFLAPAFVRVTEWAGSWSTGLLLRVPHSFLKVQLSRNLSRSVGTAVSMSCLLYTSRCV